MDDADLPPGNASIRRRAPQLLSWSALLTLGAAFAMTLAADCVQVAALAHKAGMPDRELASKSIFANLLPFNTPCSYQITPNGLT